MTNEVISQILDTWKKRGRIETAAGATALQSLRRHAEMEHTRVRAEDRAAHKKLWGEDMPKDEEDMGDIILGDNITNVPQGEFGQLAGKALLALAVGGPLSFIGSKYLDRPAPAPAPVTEIMEDTDTRTGLRILRDPARKD